jgi:hypothetical protein
MPASGAATLASPRGLATHAKGDPVKRSIALLLAIAIAAPLHAGPPSAMAEADRAATGRTVAVSLYPDITTSVDVGRVMADNGGGSILGAIIVASMDDKRKILTAHANDAASATVAPLAAALKGFDASELARDTTQKALAASDWFKASRVAVVPSAGAATWEALFTANPSDQVGIVTYRYQMSPDFTHLRVIANINVARQKGRDSIYAQQIVGLVELKHRSYDRGENVARWSSNDGALAKQAIAAAFARLETVIPAVLDLTPARFNAATDKTKVGSAFAAGFYGPQLMSDEKGVVIWSKGNGFIAAQTAND